MKGQDGRSVRGNDGETSRCVWRWVTRDETVPGTVTRYLLYTSAPKSSCMPLASAYPAAVEGKAASEKMLPHPRW